jgi:hypothetical protein
VKETALLIAVQRIVGRVQVEHDLARRFLMGVEKKSTNSFSIAAASWPIL